MLVVAAALLVVVAAYAQWQVPKFVRGTTKVWMTRLFLAGLGLAVGYVMVPKTGVLTADSIALFLIGFAIVSVPAAIVLFLKNLRGESLS
jgi:hypothetical protein